MLYAGAMKPGFTGRALAIGALVAFAFAGQAAAGAIVVHGVTMPAGSQQVGEDRYRVPLNFQEAERYFTYHKGYKPHQIIHQPGIRAVNLENNAPGEWESMNIYEKDGEVRVYVLARAVQPKKERRKEK